LCRVKCSGVAKATLSFGEGLGVRSSKPAGYEAKGLEVQYFRRKRTTGYKII
jgi:hypothetical protein